MKNLNDNSCVGVFTSPLNKTNKLINGDTRQFFGKWFVYSGGVWILNEVCSNVIDNKHSGTNKPYGAQHPTVK